MGTTTRISSKVSGESHLVWSLRGANAEHVATEPFDEVMDREIKGLHAERVGWEGTLVRDRRRYPAHINRISSEVEYRRSHGEWMPEDDVPIDGMSSSSLAVDDC
jgi:hypothetical protein